MTNRSVEAKCGNCRAWIHQLDLMAGPVTIGAPKRGLCHMLPPTPFAKLGDGRVLHQTNLRAATMETDFCLMFEPGDLPIEIIPPKAANN